MSEFQTQTSEKESTFAAAKVLDQLDLANSEESTISFHVEVPSSLQAAMTGFIEKYPCWDQYRLIQAALAGFLVENGSQSRQITRLYLGNMFCNNAYAEDV